jgi:fibrillarin-like pre-rRNA processing protein
MREIKIEGVTIEGNKLFTENLPECKGLKVYDEKLLTYKNKEYRSWNPYKSKLAAAILNGLEKIELFEGAKVLYLGAATGTTVSHISDIIKNQGIIYAVEISPLAIKQLLKISEKRRNILPILADANQPEMYANIITSPVDLVYQDIAQRDQVGIFVKNVNKFLKKYGEGILIVKARSVDVSKNPKEIYEDAIKKLEKNGLSVKKVINLLPYEKDHTAIIIKKQVF